MYSKNQPIKPCISVPLHRGDHTGSEGVPERPFRSVADVMSDAVARDRGIAAMQQMVIPARIFGAAFERAVARTLGEAPKLVGGTGIRKGF